MSLTQHFGISLQLAKSKGAPLAPAIPVFILVIGCHLATVQFTTDIALPEPSIPIYQLTSILSA